MRIRNYPVPLSMTTAGREVAESMRGGKEIEAVEEAAVTDLRQRSDRGFRMVDHGR